MAFVLLHSLLETTYQLLTFGQFEQYFGSKGIRLKDTMPKMPELNGLAGRMNQTVMERVRSMLAHAKLSKKFWVEA